MRLKRECGDGAESSGKEGVSHGGAEITEERTAGCSRNGEREGGKRAESGDLSRNAVETARGEDEGKRECDGGRQVAVRGALRYKPGAHGPRDQRRSSPTRSLLHAPCYPDFVGVTPVTAKVVDNHVFVSDETFAFQVLAAGVSHAFLSASHEMFGPGFGRVRRSIRL